MQISIRKLRVAEINEGSVSILNIISLILAITDGFSYKGNIQEWQNTWAAVGYSTKKIENDQAVFAKLTLSS